MCLEQFYLDGKVRNLSPKTLTAYGERLGDFHRFLQAARTPFDQVSRDTVRRYILDMQGRVSDHTINGRIRALHRFFGFLEQEGLWDGRANPLNGIKCIKTDKVIKPVLSQEQIADMLHRITRHTFYGYRNFCMVLLFWDTLIRLSELTNLRLDDLDLKVGTIRVMGKGRKERVLPLGAQAMRHLHGYLNRFRQALPGQHVFCTRHGLRLRGRYVQQILQRIGKRVGFHVSPHLLRHSGASHLALTGIPAFMLQRLLGHTTLSTTNIYIHLIDDQRLRDVFRQFSPGDGLRL